MYTLEQIYEWMWQVELGQVDSKPIDQYTDEETINGND